MANYQSLLTRWQKAGVLDADSVARIGAFELEQERPAGLRWQGIVALILGAILLACGVVLFVSAHWDQIGPGARYALVLAMVAIFHLGGAWARESFRSLSTALHAVGTVAIGAAIALVGQIFNIQEHWPAAVLLWAIAALAGWALLRDEAQQIFALLLVPAWLFCELFFAADGHIGINIYVGRFLVVWAVLYLTYFLGSKRKAVQGILFAAAVIAATAGTCLLQVGWRSYGNETFLAFGPRMWGWAAIAVPPLVFALIKLRKSMLPVAAAIVFSMVLPWCQGFAADQSQSAASRYSGPSPAAYVLVAAFAVFIAWWGFSRKAHVLAGLGVVWFAAAVLWFASSDIFGELGRSLIGQVLEAATALFIIRCGVRAASKALVNLGIVGFALVVLWFYFSDIYDKVDRSLALLGLGVLFLAGGWALEKTRRGIIGRMDKSGPNQADIAKEGAL